MPNYLDNLLLYTRKGLEELSRNPIQYTKQSIKELIVDCFGNLFWTTYYYFKKPKAPYVREIIQEPHPKSLEEPKKEPINFIEELLKTQRDDLLDL